MSRPDRRTLIAFGLLILFGGSNAVAVRFSNLELPPFWGAAIRFSTAALIFWLILLVRRIALPRGRALLGVLLYGIMAIGVNYALLYWALLSITAGFTMVVAAFAPLLTVLFALAHGQEPFRWRGLAGASIAIVGILIAASGGLGSDIPATALLALVVSIAFVTEGSVVLKMFPPSHPVAINAIAITTGAIVLSILSLATGEARSLPTTSNTWLSFIYLVLLGTVALFYLYMFVLSRWTASATNYSFLLFPIVTVIMAAWLLGEEVTIAFVLGGAIVLLGVWIGAFGGPKKSADADSLQPQEEVAG